MLCMDKMIGLEARKVEECERVCFVVQHRIPAWIPVRGIAGFQISACGKIVRDVGSAGR